MASLKHVHSYIRLDKKGNYFKCADPYCSHYAKKELVIGKASACPDCKTHFVLTREDLRRARPLCLNCSDTAAAKQHRAAKELLQQLLPVDGEIKKGAA